MPRSTYNRGASVRNPLCASPPPVQQPAASTIGGFLSLSNGQGVEWRMFVDDSGRFMTQKKRDDGGWLTRGRLS